MNLLAKVTNYLYFCIMEKNKERNVGPKMEAGFMREKAEHYLVCFIDCCPLGYRSVC